MLTVALVDTLGCSESLGLVLSRAKTGRSESVSNQLLSQKAVVKIRCGPVYGTEQSGNLSYPEVENRFIFQDAFAHAG